MKKHRLKTTLTGFALVFLIAGLAFGVSSYLTQFNTRYGTSGTSLASCSLCHPGGNTAQLNGYGNDYASHNHDYAAIEALDSDGDGYSNLAEIQARTLPGDATSHPVADATPPTVSAFVIPSTSSSLVVSITTFTATDNVGVTGYVVTETAQKPAATAAGWTATAPTSYSFTTAGAKTLYAWAKDAAGNVSTTTVSATVTITLADTAAPSVTAFTVPASSNSLAVTISTFTATDNVGVTGYLITETNTRPAATAAGWSATKPTTYTATASGAKTLYAWAKDAAGNVSSTVVSATVTITLADTAAPTITGFVVPAASGSLNVPITTFTATDNVGVTGYIVTSASAAPALSDPGWSATPPLSFTFTTTGAKTLYAWARDAAGNISAGASQTVTITSGDVTPPVITNFSLPVDIVTLKVPILAFTASDDTAVTGYMVNESATPPLPTAAGWTATPPASYTFKSEGPKALYAWAKDAAGNVSIPWSDMVDVVVTDVTPPQVMDFTIDNASNSLIIPIRKFIAYDDIEVTGYMVTRTSTPPRASASGWRSTPPTSYTFTTSGTKILYGWAKDAAGNVSEGLSDQVTISISDRDAPEVTEFSVPSTSGTLTVPITQFAAADNGAVAGYMVTANALRPAWSSPKWSATPPANFTFSSTGTKTLYPWVRDAAGNVSRKFTGTGMKVKVSVNAEKGQSAPDDKD